jgi:hypothetical protein
VRVFCAEFLQCSVGHPSHLIVHPGECVEPLETGPCSSLGSAYMVKYTGKHPDGMTPGTITEAASMISVMPVVR